MLPIKKIYIDSRFKSSDSASDSDFKIDLPISFLMPEDTGFYIDDVCIPHTPGTQFPKETMLLYSSLIPTFTLLMSLTVIIPF